MPRSPRLDSPGTLHHVIIRGIEKREIVADDEDRDIFVSRMGFGCLENGNEYLCLGADDQSCAYPSQKPSTGTLCIHEDVSYRFLIRHRQCISLSKLMPL